jgi:hypothetical protein
MNASELKLKIFRQIDSLEKTSLEDFYGILINYVNSKKEINDWVELSDVQKQGIIDAIEEIDSGKGVSHNSVLRKYRKKYLHCDWGFHLQGFNDTLFFIVANCWRSSSFFSILCRLQPLPQKSCLFLTTHGALKISHGRIFR